MKKHILENLLTNVAHNPYLQLEDAYAAARKVVLELQAVAGVIEETTASPNLSSIPFILGFLQSLHRWLKQHKGKTYIIAPTKTPQP